MKAMSQASQCSACPFPLSPFPALAGTGKKMDMGLRPILSRAAALHMLFVSVAMFGFLVDGIAFSDETWAAIFHIFP